jgi:hypothetical protein
MAVVTITLSDDELLQVREQAARRGFVEIEDYLRDAVTEQLNREEPDNASDAPLVSKEQLEAMILEGLASPARVRTKQDFDQVRAEIIARHRSRGR